MVRLLSKIILVVLFITTGESALAQFTMPAFFKKRTSTLNFTTSAQSISKSNCSGITTLQTKNASGAVTNVGSNLTVNLTTPDSVVFYSDSSCLTSTTSVIVLSGTSSISFYFISNAVGSAQINATAASYATGVQVETVITNAYVWTGGGADANWATGLNWSGGVAPGAAVTALFDNTCAINCSPTMAVNTTVGGVRMTTGYAGTITQAAAKTLTINSNGWVQQAGTFQGGDSTITLNSTFAQTGGTFIATSGNLVTKSHFYQTAGTFTHNSGTLLWQPGCCTTYYLQVLNSLNNLTLNESNSVVWITGNITVLGNMVLNDQQANLGTLQGSGVILLWGNLTVTNFNGGGALIKLVGSSQTITGTAARALSSLEIASTGTVTLAGDIGISKNFTYTSGTIIPGASTLRFTDYAVRTIVANNINLNNVNFNVYNSDITMTGTMNVDGNLTFNDTYGAGTYTQISGGVFNLSGNLNITSWMKDYGDNFTLNIVGDNTRTQTLTGTSGSAIHAMTINSASTVNLAGNIGLRGNYTYTAAGSFNAGTSTLEFKGSTATNTITTGAVNYNNVTFTNFNNSNSNTYTLSGTMNILGNLLLAQTNVGNTLNSGTLAVGGNVTMTNFLGGTTALTLNGTGTQTITRTAGTFPTGNISISKASGTVELASAISWNSGSQATSVTAGAVNVLNMNNFALTLTSLALNGNTLTKGGGVLTVGGVAAGTGSLYGGTIAP
ncbi:MAG: hypothetical protein WA160_10075 [Pseudobdellovibrio sp.]